jgi:hypothetical protein
MRAAAFMATKAVSVTGTPMVKKGVSHRNGLKTDALIAAGLSLLSRSRPAMSQWRTWYPWILEPVKPIADLDPQSDPGLPFSTALPFPIAYDSIVAAPAP